MKKLSRRWSRALGWIATVGLAFAAGARADPGATPVDQRWLVKRVDFDGNPASVERPLVLSSGRKGRGMRLGQGASSPELALRGVVDLARPGAITAWIRPSEWQSPSVTSQYVPVFRVTGAGPAVVVIERDRRYPGRPIDVWIAGYFALASRAEVQMQREMKSLWAAREWHFVAFQWDSTGFSLQIDDLEPARTALPRANLVAEFPRASSTLVIGSAAPEGFIVDDLSIWSRQLTRSEIASLRAD